MQLATDSRILRSVSLGTTTIALLVACTPSGGGGTACGITALAGATMLLDQFAVPRQTIAAAPLPAPSTLPIRVAAGPALRAAVGLGVAGWAVDVEGTLPEGEITGFGVLVVGPDAVARGIMLYSGPPVPGAPQIGTVTVQDLEVPLIGLQADIAGLETPACPFFPDSLRGP